MSVWRESERQTDRRKDRHMLVLRPAPLVSASLLRNCGLRNNRGLDARIYICTDRENELCTEWRKEWGVCMHYCQRSWTLDYGECADTPVCMCIFSSSVCRCIYSNSFALSPLFLSVTVSLLNQEEVEADGRRGAPW